MWFHRFRQDNAIVLYIFLPFLVNDDPLGWLGVLPLETTCALTTWQLCSIKDVTVKELISKSRFIRLKWRCVFLQVFFLIGAGAVSTKLNTERQPFVDAHHRYRNNVYCTEIRQRDLIQHFMIFWTSPKRSRASHRASRRPAAGHRHPNHSRTTLCVNKAAEDGEPRRSRFSSCLPRVEVGSIRSTDDVVTNK